MSTVFPSSPSNGDTYIPPQIQKLLASDLETADYFGWAVDISKDGYTAIIGAYGDNVSRGSAYIFTRVSGTWTEQQKLIASPSSAIYDSFGRSVALSSDGNTAIIGADGEDTAPNTDNGAVYVFTRSGSTWTQQQKITASDAASNEQFGISVALSLDGNTALIGAYAEDTSPNTDNGAAYVFTRSAGVWTQQQKLTASDAAQGDFFGGSVALSADGDTALIGAYSDNSAVGSAYIFTRAAGTWTEQQKLTPPDAALYDYFGYSVSLSSGGDTALIGAWYNDTSPYGDNGAAYVFTRSAGVWTQQQKLLASDRQTSDYFGGSVALSADGDTALIGAYGEDTSPNTDNGAIYIFTRSGSTWTQKTKLVASDRATDDYFGYSVALSADGSVALTGANYESTSPATGNGAAYVYNFTNTGTRYTYNSTDNRWEVDTSTPRKAPTTHLFTSSVSGWAIPTNAKAIHAVVIAGGGSGGVGGVGTSYAGGGGGGGGGMSIHTYNLITGYQTTADIGVGAGATNGTGGTSSFRLSDGGGEGVTLTAAGGTAGGTGGVSSSNAGNGGRGMFDGGWGGAGLDTGSNFSPTTASGARGGGSGGGNDTSNRAGGIGSVSPLIWTAFSISPGPGGNGGVGSTSSTGGAGEVGQLYGGGGGGGGASASGFSGGARGTGAQGCVFLTVWYA